MQVGANLGKHGYLPEIAQATQDIDIQVVFCNAGYMLTGFFETKCGLPDRICVPCCSCVQTCLTAHICRSLDDQLTNLECNATSAVSITHHYLRLMVCAALQMPKPAVAVTAKLATALQRAKQLKGCFVFTSSAAAAIVSPFTVMYAASKSFLSTFGASLAAEVRHAGIDVLVFHPSPVRTRCSPADCSSKYCNAAAAAAAACCFCCISAAASAPCGRW